jgi:omega-amidase
VFWILGLDISNIGFFRFIFKFWVHYFDIRKINVKVFKLVIYEGAMGRYNPKIALAQIKYFGSSNDNLDKVKKFIELAKKERADIVCFPESCLHKNRALHFKHKIVKEIQEHCKKHSIWCIITEDMKVKSKKYNCAILIDRNGNITGDYKKINLYGDDVSPGKEVKVFETDFAKIGIAICWDLNFSDLFREMKNMGAEIIFCPSLWCYDFGIHKGQIIKKERKILESLIISRAYENFYYVAICNPAKESRYHISYSAIASPSTILNSLYKKEGLVVSRLNMSRLKDVRC